MLRFGSWNFRRSYRRPPACPPELRLEPPPLCELPTLRLGDELRLGALLTLRLGALLMLRLGAEWLLTLLLGREVLLLLPKLRLGLELLLLPTLLLGRELLLPEPKSRLGLELLPPTLLLGLELLLGVLPTPDSGLLTPDSGLLVPDSVLLVPASGRLAPDSDLPTPRSRPLPSTRPPFSMRPLPSGRAVTRVELWFLPWNSPRSQRSCIPTCSLLGARKCSLWP